MVDCLKKKKVIEPLPYLDRAVVVEPGQELGGIPVGVRCFPVSIRPDQLRSVPAISQPGQRSNIPSEGCIDSRSIYSYYSQCAKHVCDAIG